MFVVLRYLCDENRIFYMLIYCLINYFIRKQFTLAFQRGKYCTTFELLVPRGWFECDVMEDEWHTYFRSDFFGVEIRRRRNKYLLWGWEELLNDAVQRLIPTIHNFSRKNVSRYFEKFTAGIPSALTPASPVQALISRRFRVLFPPTSIPYFECIHITYAIVEPIFFILR